MPKDKLTDYSSTNASNTDVGGVNIDEGMLPSSVNNAIRELMTHQANAFGAGTPLYVDETNDRLGVGTTSPTTKLDIISNGAGGDIHVANGSGQNCFLELAGNNNNPATTSALYGQDASGNAYAWQRANAPLLFGTNNTERMRILSGGGITFNGDTASANGLSDYEEGTWTPTLNTGTCTTGYGKYTKIGNLVRVQAQLSAFSDRTSSSAVIINNLPFTSASDNRSSQGVMARFVNATGDAVAAYIFQSSSQLSFYACNQGTTYTQVKHSHLSSSSSTFFISITYLV